MGRKGIRAASLGQLARSLWGAKGNLGFMKVLLLSAYHADSHRLWLMGLMKHLPAIDWTVLSLPPRYFSWRIRGNSLSWALLEKATLEADYDVCVATSMTDLSALRGLVPKLARLPTAVYFHENQFAYPGSEQQREGVEPQILNLYTALAADKLLFNSDYNRDSFLAGSDHLLSRLPDFVPRAEVAARFLGAEVLPVGIDIQDTLPRLVSERLSVLWNHRWEYDKGPDRLLALVKECDHHGLKLDFYIAGQQFRQQPEAFTAIQTILLDSASLELKQWGFVADPEDYQSLMATCDVVLSTAIHDFQGLSVLQAVAAGCTPLVPDRLCYPQWFASQYHYVDGGEDIALEANSAATGLARLQTQKASAGLSSLDVSDLSWTRLAPRYLQVLESLSQR